MCLHNLVGLGESLHGKYSILYILSMVGYKVPIFLLYCGQYPSPHVICDVGWNRVKTSVRPVQTISSLTLLLLLTNVT